MVIKQNTVNLQCDKGGVAHGTQSEQNKKEERRKGPTTSPSFVLFILDERSTAAGL